MSKQHFATHIKKKTEMIKRKIIDVHTHLYLPRYLQLLRNRTEIPRILTDKTTNSDRLIILPNEDVDASTQSGRPVGKEYYDMAVKSAFMKRHGITTSVLSLANPWLDFLTDQQASTMATDLNKDLDEICESSNGAFYGFGVLPNTSAKACVNELHHISKLKYLKGVIMGTFGVGEGLDDPRLVDVFVAAQELGLTVFLHPHYGVGNQVYGDRPNGHVLPLALGFPFETTIVSLPIHSLYI